MIRWLVIGLLLFGFVTGVRHGWLLVRWELLLHQLGVPFVPRPAPQSDCPSPPKAAVSSARQAR
jgi:hypothetical protein